MNDIRALLKIAARRLETNAFIGQLHLAAMAAGILALLLMAADRATASAFVPWAWVGPALGALTLLAAVILWRKRRSSEAHVALLVDERLELREKLSTALHVHGRDDAFAQAAIEDAVQAARDPRVHERVRRTFAVQPPRGWYISPLLVLAAVMMSLLQPLDLFAREEQVQSELINATAEAEQSVQAIFKAIKAQPELEKEMADVLGELSKQGIDPNAIRKPEDSARAALKTTTEIAKKLDEILNGEKAKTAEALDRALSQLKTPEDGAAKDLADALARGDFSKAQELVKQLMEKAENGQLSEEEKQQAAEQLKDIAEQLEKLAQQQQQLEQALKAAGLDPNLAQNPQALQQAIQNNPNLNDQQKQQLQQMAQAQQAACQMCQGLGQACQQMAQGLQGGQLGQAGQQMGQQLGQLEQLQQLLQQAQAAANACKGQSGQLGQGLCMQQAIQQWMQGNGGMGNRGQGAGGKAPIAPTPTGTKLDQARVNTVEGDIIAKQLFQGQLVRGEMKAKLVQVIQEQAKGFDDPLAETQLHRKYDESLKHYFGELEKITKAMPAAGEQPAAEQATPSESNPSTESGG